jgi:thioesterase-3
LSHSFSKKILGFHCDAYGHVNNARYLEFLEEARWSALETANLIQLFKDLRLQFFLVNVNISFKKPLLPSQEIEIVTQLGEIKRKTMSFVQTIKIGTVVVSVAEVTFVLYNTETKGAETITAQHLNHFNSFKYAPS